jgi:hypothetical protein
MKRLLRAARRIALASCLASTAPPIGAADEPTSGNGITALYLRWTGAVPYQEHDVKYLLVDLKSTTDPQGRGSILVMMPLVDVLRDDAGRPIIQVSDPGTGGDFRLPGSAAPTSGLEVARAVWDGSLAKDTPLVVTLPIRLIADAELKKAVLDGAQVQLSKRAEARDSAYSTARFSGDFERAEKSVILLPAKEIRVVCLTPGLQDIAFVLEGSPTLAGVHHLQATVPARWLGFAYGKGGVALSARFFFEAYTDDHSRVDVNRVVHDVADLVLSEDGRGSTAHATSGLAADVSILVTRDELRRLSQSSRWKEKITVSVGSNEDANLLLKMFHDRDVDTFSLSAQETADWLDRSFRVHELLNDPGFVTELNAATAKETLSTEEVERFRSKLNAHASAGSGGIMASVPGVGSLGLAGGGSSSDAEGSKENDRKEFLNFLRDLKQLAQKSKVPFHPTLKYALVDRARLNRALDSSMVLHRAGKVATLQLSSPFTTAHPTIDPDRPKPTAGTDLAGTKQFLQRREEVARLSLEAAARLKAIRDGAIEEVDPRARPEE